MLTLERQKSDQLNLQQTLELASVSLLRQAKDRSEEDSINIKRQVWDEETTRFAEVLDGPVDTSFDFYVGPDGLRTVSGTSLSSLWANAVDSLALEKQYDPRLEEIYKIRQLEQAEGEIVEQLALNQLDNDSFMTISPYPEDLEKKFGAKFLAENGFNPSRKLSFVRQYTKIPGGARLRTMSVDNSNFKNWQLVINSNFGKLDAYAGTTDILAQRLNKNISIDELVEAYDQSLGSNYNQGINFNQKIETWGFVTSQTDVLNYYFSELEKIVGENLGLGELLRRKKQLSYNVCATLEKRYAGKINYSSNLGAEISQAGHQAMAEGKSYSACGISLSISNSESEASSLKNILQISANTMKCVTCPFCKKTVDAKVSVSKISCPSCKTSVDKKTGKVSEGKNIKRSPTFRQIIEQVLEALFTDPKKKTKNS